MLEKTPESPLESKEIKPVNLKENQPWIFAGRTDAKAETPVFWWSDATSWFIGKVPDAGKDWGQKKKRASDDEMPNHLSVMFVCNHVRRETAAKRSREALEENESLLTPRTLIVAFSSGTWAAVFWFSIPHDFQVLGHKNDSCVIRTTHLTYNSKCKRKMENGSVFLYFFKGFSNSIWKNLQVFPGVSVQNLPAVQKTQVWSLGWEDLLEREMASYCNILAWEIPWTEEPGGL